TDGLDMTDEQIAAVLAVDAEEWRAEIPQIAEWFDKIGDTLPSTMLDELETLKRRLDA
ncbi:MAG: phosphoenolpyruvate carboxykinase domain-containing protein, partial [Actinomycetota bacterium]|nr:phosphoenolpyruvate carboxykinase domain-containing protein [Actinomycetota bacterium]